MPRSLMTDKIQILQAPEITTSLGEKVRKRESAVVVATGLGSLQLYFSAEYDVDRDTLSRIGRIISDDPNLAIVNWSHWIVVNDQDWYDIDGQPQVWTLRGRHHIEVNIKRLTDGV